jgi:hypothetical protein
LSLVFVCFEEASQTLLSHKIEEIFDELGHLSREFNLGEVFKANLPTLKGIVNRIAGDSQPAACPVSADLLLLYDWSACIEVGKRFIY